ncbi:LolA family protein [Actinokineospora xionganensis]|uniref:Outer membrane lipoprotein carrier protein LolA n=1 Tax=Actinokineospora xionganensis TaxID=2684470 RepID=A0ABR7LEY7_9PSEU|nr:sigma-E factor regulatory protein RseB domain-containing protein [Actinokineospora xionganensis]MBC6451158.1 outer membrane lipoprotein carrier protein LolA [Actinokineospora xionganensis]
MDRKRTALTVAAAGTATGVVGLILLATPAGAGEQPPALPEISPEALVESVIKTEKIPAMSGAVEFTSDLGIPVPGLPQAGSGGEAAHVYTDGEGRARVSISQGGSERTIVHDGTTTWMWNSADRSVQKMVSGEHEKKTAEHKLADPATAAREFIGLMGKDSTITVDGTARVADRPVYQLVLTPKPTERTLLREVRVAVDSETRLPLRLEVLANGQAEPALRIGFTDFETGAQDASLFTYTPPAGAKVTESKPGDHKPSEAELKEKQNLFESIDGKTVGEGWDTVLVGKVPAELLTGEVKSGERGTTDPSRLLKQFGKEVSGPFGTGYVISSKVGTLLVTADGRAALGAVPQQVLVDALGAK